MIVCIWSDAVILKEAFMHIKTEDGAKNVASQAVGGTALGLAIPGTLAFLGQLGNGILGGDRKSVV